MSAAEIDVMRCCQDMGARGPFPALARAYSMWGEHAAGWMALGAVGAIVDRPRREVWAHVAAAAFTAHAAAVVVKRVVRRRRPSDPCIRVLVGTPSDLSFPSAHAASTTAAAVALSPVAGAPAGTVMATTMGLARVLLGVHYPTDVAAGALIGVVAGRLTRTVIHNGMVR